jgi:hypothetical protein
MLWRNANSPLSAKARVGSIVQAGRAGPARSVIHVRLHPAWQEFGPPRKSAGFPSTNGVYTSKYCEDAMQKAIRKNNCASAP